MNKKKIALLALILLVIIAGIVAIYKNNTDVSSAPANKEYSVATPEGWKRYENMEWGFTFSYPANWIFEENYLDQKNLDLSGSDASVGQFTGVTLNGDGYLLRFGNNDRELSDQYTYTHPEYIITGQEAKTIKFETESTFGLYLAVPLKKSSSQIKSLTIFVGNTDSTAKYIPLIDQILSTIEIQ